MSLLEPEISPGNETLIQMNMLFPDCCQLVSEQPRSSAWAFYAAEWSSFIIMLLTGLTQGTLNDSANISVMQVWEKLTQVNTAYFSKLSVCFYSHL